MSDRTSADPAEPRAQRRIGPLALGVVLVMAASAGGLYFAWRAITHSGGGPVPIIRAEGGPVKVAPANPGGMVVPDQNIAVLNGKGPGNSQVEQLLPPPETPLPRPAPPPQPEVSQPPPPTAAPAAAPPAAAPPVLAPVVTPAVTAPPPAAPPAHLATAGQGYRLQVGAVRSEEAAQQEWARLKRAQADLLGKLDMRTARTDLGARGIFYRIEAGPIADGEVARLACDKLKERKVGCILVRP